MLQKGLTSYVVTKNIFAKISKNVHICKNYLKLFAKLKRMVKFFLSKFHFTLLLTNYA